MRQITAMGWFSRVLPLLTTIFASTSFAQLPVSYMVIPRPSLQAIHRY